MDEDRAEHELRSVFKALKNEEVRVAPDFELLVRSAARRPHRAPPRIRPWARLAGMAGVATVLALILCGFPPGLRHSAVELEAWSALSQWTASTDNFLEPSGISLGGVQIATPSDAWMNNVVGRGNPQPDRKETL